ncbi:MAG: Mrp/NBP35 family ATP-binding protein [Bacillota bacterium]
MEKKTVHGEKSTQAPLEKWSTSEFTEIGGTLAVMSGKGGVGKSTITALTAVALARAGRKVGILDADITGPSIPKMFGLKERLAGREFGLVPAVTKDLGIEVVSLNLFLDEEDTPVIWRGPLLAGAVRQFWSEVAWGRLDYLVIDLPPGTGDVPLSVMQSVPLDGLLIVSSPQDLAVMVVSKAIKMAKMLGKKIIGLVENMGQVVCPRCGETIYPFGRSRGREIAARAGIDFLGGLPVDPELARLADEGRIEEYQDPLLAALVAAVASSLGSPVGDPKG